MEVISNRSSSLNPNAPLFVPCAYRAVEDFSDEWWELVQSSTWFRDYWLQECFQDPQNTPEFEENDDFDLLPEIDDLFDGYSHSQEEQEKEEEKVYCKDLISVGSGKFRKSRGIESPKYAEKAPKFVNVKVSPRAIQQPR